MISVGLVAALAAELDGAALTARPVAPLTERHPELNLDDAYAVQAALVERWTARGGRVVGYKVGLTSEAMRHQLGIDEPDSGVLLDGMVFTDGAVIDGARLIAPRAEAEIALILGRGLDAGASCDDAADAVESAAVAIEVIDSRIADWRIAIEDTVADNASSACAVVGWPVPLTQVGDLRTVGLVLRVGGQVAATGAGAAVLGNPLLTLVWLAERLAEHGRQLQAGDVVLPGAVHASVPLRPGDVVTATGTDLGSVSLRVSAGT